MGGKFLGLYARVCHLAVRPMALPSFCGMAGVMSPLLLRAKTLQAW